MFVKGSSRSWNVFLWLGLFMGMGLLMCLYSMEWFARKNCPENCVSIRDGVYMGLVATKRDSYQSPQLQRLARELKFRS